MKKLLILFLFYVSSAQAEGQLQLFIESALKNNLKLNAEKKIKNQLNKILIFREANSCLVYLYQAIRAAHSRQTKLIKVAQI